MDLEIVVDGQACVDEFGQWAPGLLKHRDDLARYRHILTGARRLVVVETGTSQGGSARWFARQAAVEMVITVDIRPDRREPIPGDERILWLAGSSVDPDITADIRRMTDGHRVMVILDSDHSEDHVRAEIEIYRELVTPGCHLVVEDAVIDWLPSPKPHGCDVFTGSLHTAIADLLLPDPRFERDTEVEALSAVTMSPAGWWRRVS